MNIGVVMGGFSSEREISIKSGSFVVECLKESPWNIIPVVISEGNWLAKSQNKEIEIDKNDFSFFADSKIKIDLVVNMIHGAPGETGEILSYLELLNIPYIGNDAYTSAITFNKYHCNRLVASFGIPTAKSIVLNKGEDYNLEEIKNLGFPLFIKPNEGGSSIGMSKVSEEKELLPAIERAFKEGETVLVEQFLEGKEFTVGIIPYQNKTVVLPITELVSHNDFFDYEAKYQGLSDEITPARIDEYLEEKLKNIALKTYHSLGMKGITRTEYIISDGEPHFLDMNTVPGMTAESILPQQIEAAGLNVKDVFEDLINEKIKKLK